MSNAIALLTISTHKITYTCREPEPVTAIFVICRVVLIVVARVELTLNNNFSFFLPIVVVLIVIVVNVNAK